MYTTFESAIESRSASRSGSERSPLAAARSVLRRILQGIHRRRPPAPYEMRHEAHLRGPLGDEVRRAGWL